MRSSDSGVVLTASRTSPATRYSMVPTMPGDTAGGAQRRIEGEDGGRLAVGAGDAGECQPLVWRGVEAPGGDGECFAAVFHLNPGAAEILQRRQFGDDCDGALLHRRAGELSPVSVCAGEGEEERSRGSRGASRIRARTPRGPPTRGEEERSEGDPRGVR